MGIPSEEQKLLLNGKLLTAESKIEDNSTLALVVALEGGAKGKNILIYINSVLECLIPYNLASIVPMFIFLFKRNNVIKV